MGIKAKIASLVVDIAGNSASFNSELKKSKRNARGWASDVKRHAKVGAAAIAAAGAASAAGLAVLTAESMKSIDALAKTSDKLGIATQHLAGLRHQAELNGVAQRSLDNSLQAMVRRVSEAADGTGTASKALAELGISAEELEKLSPDQQFAKISAEMAGVKNQADKVKLSYQIFGREGIGMVNVMRGGSAAMAESVKEAELLGVAVNRIDAAKIEAANDAAFRSDQAWKGLGNTIAIAVSPVLTQIKTDFVESAKKSNGFKDEVAMGMKIISKSIGFAGNALHGMKMLWKGAQVVVATFVAESVTHLASLAQATAEAISFLPGVDVKLDENSGIVGFAKAAQSQVRKLKKELHDTAMQDLPSEKVDQWLKNAESSAKKTAEEVAAANQGLSGSTATPAEFGSQTEADKVERELTAGNEHFSEAYERRQAMLDAALESKQISEQRHQQISVSNWTKYQTEIQRIDQERAAARLQTGKQFFGDLASLSAHGNKRLASIGKAAAKVNILIGTYEAAQNAYTHASKWGGPAAGVAAAAAATIAGMMRLRAVDAAGNGSAGSGGLAGSTTFDQNLPNAAANVSDIPSVAERRNQPPTHIEHYYAEGSVRAIDSQSFEQAMYENRDAVAGATESYLNEYGQSLAAG